jgi:hypothetical protein
VAFEVAGDGAESSADCGESCTGREVGGLEHGFEGGDDVLHLNLARECRCGLGEGGDGERPGLGMAWSGGRE